MRHLLSPTEARHLAALAEKTALLAFDFDGTLAPIVDDRDAAQLRTETRRLLAQTAQLYPCAVISGRAQEDVWRRLGAVPVWEVVGNHGLEPSNSAETFARKVRDWLPILRTKLEGVDGVDIEDKRLSLALHFRAAKRKAEALEAIHAAIELLGPVRLVAGKQVVNVLPPGGPDKGVALERLRLKLGCEAALYVGDDETDEDVFRLQREGHIYVRVGQKRSSQAEYYLREQAEIDELLRRLLSLRARPVARRKIG